MVHTRVLQVEEDYCLRHIPTRLDSTSPEESPQRSAVVNRGSRVLTLHLSRCNSNIAQAVPTMVHIRQTARVMYVNVRKPTDFPRQLVRKTDSRYDKI
jgi:hypothetical protein